MPCQKKHRSSKQRKRQANESPEARAERLAYQKEYRSREENQERRRQYERVYWKVPDNKQRRADRREDYDSRRKYYTDNKDRLTAQHKEWVALHKEEVQEYQKNYRPSRKIESGSGSGGLRRNTRRSNEREELHRGTENQDESTTWQEGFPRSIATRVRTKVQEEV